MHSSRTGDGRASERPLYKVPDLPRCRVLAGQSVDCYTFPEAIVTNRVQGPEASDRKKQFGHAFSLGLRFEGAGRAEDPYMTRLIELYNAHADLLLEGRFVDNESFLCDNSRVSSHAVVAGNRMAVTLWNPTDVAQRARVEAAGCELETAKWQGPGWSGPDHWIMPGDVEVLIFRRA